MTQATTSDRLAEKTPEASFLHVLQDEFNWAVEPDTESTDATDSGAAYPWHPFSPCRAGAPDTDVGTDATDAWASASVSVASVLSVSCRASDKKKSPSGDVTTIVKMTIAATTPGVSDFGSFPGSIDVASIVYLINRDDVLGDVYAIDNAKVTEAIAEVAFQLAMKPSDPLGGRVIKGGLTDRLKGVKDSPLRLGVTGGEKLAHGLGQIIVEGKALLSHNPSSCRRALSETTSPCALSWRALSSASMTRGSARTLAVAFHSSINSATGVQ